MGEALAPQDINERLHGGVLWRRSCAAGLAPLVLLALELYGLLKAASDEPRFAHASAWRNSLATVRDIRESGGKKKKEQRVKINASNGVTKWLKCKQRQTGVLINRRCAPADQTVASDSGRERISYPLSRPRFGSRRGPLQGARDPRTSLLL